jgi:hypothetical protein
MSKLLEVRRAALSQRPVSLGCRRTDSPHEYYRYPARFSPEFARAAIDAFSKVGDNVLDPFVGGGTTLVEAMRLSRMSVGADINQLATFVSKVKTTILLDGDVSSLRRWTTRVPDIKIQKARTPLDDWRSGGYLKDLESPSTWRLRVLIAEALASVEDLPSRSQQDFARCVVLRTGQWALDMRSELPTVAEFRSMLAANGNSMLEAAIEFADELSGNYEKPLILDQRSPGLAARTELSSLPADLILTSPPYPGVYVIYHRWKLLGRREIAAPYWIANRNDGMGIANYTMGARSTPSLDGYFERLKAAFTDVRQLCKPTALVVQIVGFNHIEEQLPRYLKTMVSCGFQEVQLPQIGTGEDDRLWRKVPGRRWWTTSTTLIDAAPSTAREVVLFHQPV